MYCNVNNQKLTAHRKGLRRLGLHCHDCHHALTQTYNNCAETHLGGGVMNPSVLLLSAIAWAPDPTVIGNIALRKGPRRFCPHCHDCCHALTRTCYNSPWWQSCAHCNNPSGHHCSLNSNSMAVTWQTLISKLVVCITQQGLSWWRQTESAMRLELRPATRSAVVTRITMNYVIR